MSTEIIFAIIGSLIGLTSVILIYGAIITSKKLNQRILFSNITKEERELKIKLQEYNEKLEATKGERRKRITYTYETLLFNYYEYLSICVYRKLVDCEASKMYFKDLLVSVKKIFEDSSLFKANLINKNEYKGIQWLIKEWNIL